MYLDPERIPVQDCAAVMGHLRGRLLVAHLSQFLVHPVRFLVDVHPEQIPPIVRLRLQKNRGWDVTKGSVHGLELVLDSNALVWHQITVWDLVWTVQRNLGDAKVAVFPARSEEPDVGWRLLIFAETVRFVSVDSHGDRGIQTLPPLSSLLQHSWPSVADVFCRGTYTSQRLPRMCVFPVACRFHRGLRCHHGEESPTPHSIPSM